MKMISAAAGAGLLYCPSVKDRGSYRRSEVTIVIWLGYLNVIGRSDATFFFFFFLPLECVEGCVEKSEQRK